MSSTWRRSPPTTSTRETGGALAPEYDFRATRFGGRSARDPPTVPVAPEFPVLRRGPPVASHPLHRWLVCCCSTRCEVDSVREKCTGSQTLERLRSHTRSLPGAGPERRLPAFELLSLVAVELAGIGEGRVPG